MGLRAGREDEGVVGDLATLGSHPLLRDVDRRGDRTEAQVDLLGGVPVVAAEGHPLLGRAACEVVLRGVGAVVRGGRSGAHPGDRAREAAATEHLGGREAGGAAAQDDAGRARAHGTRRGRRLLADHEESVASLRDLEACERGERGRADRVARAQIEAGVVPGAADSVAVDRAFGERAAVVRAGGADGVKLAPAAGHDHGLAHRMAEQDASLGDRCDRDALLLEIGTRQRAGLVSHGVLTLRPFDAGA